MEYQATAKYVRMSPRKVRLIADSVRGMAVGKAMLALKATPRHAAEPVLRLISSAVSNAKAKSAVADSLFVTSIEVMGGPVLKRWHAASRGMAHSYKKRMSHIKVVLSDKGAK